MSLYEEVVLKILENGPLPRAALIKLICPKIMSQKKLQNTLNELEDEQKIICVPRRNGKCKKWVSWYALPKHKHLLKVEEELVVNTIKHLKRKLLRFPTVKEIACELDFPPEDIIGLVYKSAPQTGWHPQPPKKSRKLLENSRIY